MRQKNVLLFFALAMMATMTISFFRLSALPSPDGPSTTAPHPSPATAGAQPRQQQQQQQQQQQPVTQPGATVGNPAVRPSTGHAVAMPELCHAIETSRPVFSEPKCAPLRSPDPRSSRVPLTMVTAASDDFMGHLTNNIGSVHLWEPELEVAVYDLGLSDSSKAMIGSLCGVTVIPFPYDRYPGFFHSLRNFAWKAPVVEDGARRYGKILYVDAGIELRKPISFIKRRIDQDGYFCTGMGESLTWGTRTGMSAFWNDTLSTWLGKPAIAGNVQGVAYWSGSFDGVIHEVTRCSTTASCINAEPDPGETIRFGNDQSVLSMRAYVSSAVQCAMDRAFARHIDTGMPSPETTQSRQVLFVRRGQYPKPFVKYLMKATDPKCPHKGPLTNQKNWAKLLATDPSFQTDKPCRCLRSARPVDGYQQVTSVVTAASKSWFEELKNFVGSIHFYEPLMQIYVYDIGLEDTRSVVSTWKNVHVVDFVPACEEAEGKVSGGAPAQCRGYLDNLDAGRWRPFVHLHAAITLGEFVFLSAGHELRNSLEPLVLQLRRDGLFSVTVIHDMTQWTTNEFYNQFGVPFEFFEFKPLCSPAVFGYSCDQEAFNGVVLTAANCARRGSCWGSAPSKESPYGAGSVILSASVYNNTCYTCNRDTPYYVYTAFTEEIRDKPTRLYDHLQAPKSVLYNRRKAGGKPFAKYVVNQ